MLAIINGNIQTMAGEVIENGTILIEDGKIKEVGAQISIPDGTECVDAKGNLVLPGFVDAHCHVGTFGSGAGPITIDVNEITDPLTPHLRIIDGINPMDETFTDALSGGVTTVASGPGSANVVGGAFVAMKTYGHRVDDMIVKYPLAMKCAFGENPKRCYGDQSKMPMTRMGTAALFRELLFKTREYMNKKEAAGDDSSKLPAFDMKLEAMIPVLNKEIHMKAHAHEADDIFTAIRIAKEFDIRMTIEHCTEGHLIAEDLAKDGIHAIVGPTFGHKSKFELRNKSFETPKVLTDAGVKVAIMTDSIIIPNEALSMCAALAVKAGLDEYEGLKCITINAAEILEIDDRVGSIEAGKDADIVIWDGHPFETMSKTICTIIEGKIAYQA